MAVRNFKFVQNDKNAKICYFSKSMILPCSSMVFTKMVIEQKVLIIERHMTPFWKEEIWGYIIYQNEQNLFFWLDPPIPLKKNKHH